MENFNLVVKFKLALIGAGLGFLIGLIAGNIGNQDNFTHYGLAVGLAFVLAFIGFSVAPMIIFEFGNPYWKLFILSGPVGIAFVKLAIKVFTVDGKITKRELSELNSYMQKEFGDAILLPLTDFIKENKKIKEKVLLISEPFADINLSGRIEILHRLFSMVSAERMYTADEESILKEIAKAFKLGEKRFGIIKNKVLKEKGYKTKSEEGYTRQNQSRNFNMLGQLLNLAYNPYAILETEQNVSNEDLKKAYRRLVKKYHPDKSMQENEETRRKHSVKILEINEAYENVKNMRGIK